MKTILLASAAALVAASAASAQDAQGEFKLGAGYTFLDFEDAEFHAVTARGGYDFVKYFGLEGEALVGINEEEVDVIGVNVDTKLQYSLGLFAKAHFPLSDQFTVFARAGYVWTEFEASAAGFTLSDDLDGNAYGLGGEFAINEHYSVRGEYTMYDYGDDADVDSGSISIVRRF